MPDVRPLKDASLAAMTSLAPYSSTRFATDTATLAVFDPCALVHRATDDADWWSLPKDELLEVNAGNVLFVGLGSDGVYDCHIYRDPPSEVPPGSVVACIRNVIGSIYVGAGEEVPGDGMGPSTMHGGVLVPVPAGSLTVTVVRSSPTQLQVWVVPASSPPGNSFQNTLHV
mgnify:CR=1 FL=1